MAGLAAIARDKLHASAKDLLRNIEEIISNRNNQEQDNYGSSSQGGYKNSNNTSSPLENAVRTMFSACAGVGAAANVVTPVSSYSSSEQSKAGESGGGADVRSRSRSSRSPQRVGGSQHRSSASKASRHSNRMSRGATPSTSTIQQSDFGEHIYEQLFYDDASNDHEAKARAQRAVSSLRENQDAMMMTSSPATPSRRRLSGGENRKGMHKPFPVSSPPNQPRPVIQAASPLTAEELNIPTTATFDDGISAISAHTLELMAHNSAPLNNCSNPMSDSKPLDERRKLVNSSNHDETYQSTRIGNLSTITPTIGGIDNEKTIPSTNNNSKQHLGGLLGATPMPRVSSKETWNSGRHSTPTKNSRSTQTTQSSSRSFEHWQAQEQQFWSSQNQKGNNHNDVSSPSSPSRSVRLINYNTKKGARIIMSPNRRRHRPSNQRNGEDRRQVQRQNFDDSFDSSHVRERNDGWQQNPSRSQPQNYPNDDDFDVPFDFMVPEYFSSPDMDMAEI